MCIDIYIFHTICIYGYHDIPHGSFITRNMKTHGSFGSSEQLVRMPETPNAEKLSWHPLERSVLAMAMGFRWVFNFFGSPMDGEEWT